MIKSILATKISRIRVGVGILVIISVITLIFSLSMLTNISNIDNDVVNLKDLLTTAIQAAKAGGHGVLISREFSIKSKGKTLEGANEYVTDADLRSHCLMYQTLNYKYPSIHIISEEDVDMKTCVQRGFIDPDTQHQINNSNEKFFTSEDKFVPAKDVTIWIDPLDATQEFTENLTNYVTTMVCVAIKGIPTIGVIHQPFSENGITSWGWNNYARSSDLQNAASKFETTEQEKPNIIISRSHAGPVSKKLKSVFPFITDSNIIQAGGAGYKVLEVIKKRASFYVHSTLIKKWDICAGDAILRSVGGRLSTLKNQDISYAFNDDYKNYDGVIASLSNNNEISIKFKNVNFHD